MNTLFEESNLLNSPFEVFQADTNLFSLPVKSHWHYFMEMLYVTEGSIKVIVNEELYIITPGQFILFHPQALHYIDFAEETHVSYYVTKFDINSLHITSSYTPKLEAIFRSARDSNNAPILLCEKEFPNTSIARLFELCVQENHTKDYGYDIRLQSLLSEILLEIIRYWRKLGFDTDAAITLASESTSIHTILEYIDKHCDESLIVEELAGKCDMSYSYFAKSFRELYGRSCKAYIEFMRINKAKDLLQFTNFDLNYISQETGFADCSHLIRTFTKATGTTPKQFRMNEKKPIK